MIIEEISIGSPDLVNSKPTEEVRKGEPGVCPAR
jgi:hypothetical protein